MGYRHNKFIVPLWFALALLPDSAWAWTELACTGGIPQTGTSLFNTSSVCSNNGIFSALSCSFESIINDVLSRVYCGVQYHFAPAIMTILTVYIAVFGVMLITGALQLNMREFITRALKIALVWGFTINASWGIGVALTFLLGAIDSGVGWVAMIAINQNNGQWVYLPNGCGNPTTVMQILDCLVYNQIFAPFSDQGSKIVGFFSALSIAVPPLFLFFIWFLVKSIVLLVRALITYLLGICAIAFLVSLAPIFVSFSLFKVTYSFFDSWLHYLISFAMQIVLIFASICLLFLVMSFFGNTFFDSLNTIVMDYSRTWWVGPYRNQLTDAVAVCPTVMSPSPYGAVLTCASTNPADALPPSMWIFQSGLLYSIIINLATLGIVVKLFDTLNQNIPDIARQLAGPAYAPMLGGGSGASAFGAIEYPGERLLGSASSSFTSGFSSAGGGLINRLFGGFSAGSNALKSGLGRAGAAGNPAGSGAVAQFREQSKLLAGDRKEEV